MLNYAKMFVFFSEFTKPGLFQARIFPQLGCALGVLTFFCSGADCVRRPSRVPRIIFCINLVADRVPGKFFAKSVRDRGPLVAEALSPSSRKPRAFDFDAI